MYLGTCTLQKTTSLNSGDLLDLQDHGKLETSKPSFILTVSYFIPCRPIGCILHRASCENKYQRIKKKSPYEKMWKNIVEF